MGVVKCDRKLFFMHNHIFAANKGISLEVFVNGSKE
jgi:hypothetical protein